MAIVLIQEYAGATQQQYDAILSDLNLGGKSPAGQILHTAGPMDGGWRVVDVWESQEAFNTFYQEGLSAAAQKHGMPRPQIATMQVYSMLQP